MEITCQAVAQGLNKMGQALGIEFLQAESQKFYDREVAADVSRAAIIEQFFVQYIRDVKLQKKARDA